MNTSDKIFLGNTPESAEDNLTEAQKNRWLNIFIQLSQSPRFSSFINNNYAIVDKVNHEDKSIETMVIESPVACGPELEMAQIAAIRKAVGKVKNGKEITKKILEILGQEDAPQIEVVSSIKQA